MSEDQGNQFPSGERTGTDSTGEFFSVGAPLHAVRAGYVHRKADDLLYDLVASGRYAHVLAPDRSGKSSLVAATAAKLEGNGFKVAILDLEQIGVRDGGGDPGRWYYNVAYRLLRQLRIRYDLQTWWHDRTILSNRQRLVEFYSEIILQFVAEPIVIFVDEIQCIENLESADQFLASIRAAHNARTTDPDFLRLTFVLLGECDPVSLVSEPELSPFNVTQQVLLDDFTREHLELFATELNLDQDDAEVALDRIYYWTRGQPYLTQKLARQLARDDGDGDTVEQIDRIALSQLAGRAALHSEPHMSHIHRKVVDDDKHMEALLNLYGRIRKGIEVPADLGSSLQRRLIAIGLLEIDYEGNLRVRNRLYESVFTARWANENLPTRLRVPAMVAGVLLLFALLPFWYTQLLPRPYMGVLTSPGVELEVAQAAFENLGSFPGHADTANNLFRSFIEQRAQVATSVEEVEQVVALAAELPGAERLPDELRAAFWDRQAFTALRNEHRDRALLATLQSLVLPTSHRRQRAASLVSDDYPLLLASLPPQDGSTTVFDPANLLLTTAQGAQISQWSYATQQLQQRETWSVTALEVVPLVRRVFVDREGAVSRIGLTLNISHARMTDLRIKLIAPSGRAVEIETGLERASSSDEIRIPSAQLADLVGESLPGTWSVSVRDESLGVAGQFVGWNLKLNSQGAIEDFQRGLNIPDPVEKETENVWFGESGRYAIARAMQSDSARIWDLAFAEPVRAIAVNENETLIGLDAGARHLVTATQDTVNLWDTATGDRVSTLAVGPVSADARLTGNGTQLFVVRRGDIETRLERWSIDEGVVTADLVVAGVPALVAIDPTGSVVAAADYDRAVRVWDLESGEQLAQIHLPVQPSAIRLASGGDTLGVVYGRSGVSLWSIERPQHALLEEFGEGDWKLVFAPSGARVLAGRAQIGYQVYSSRDGQLGGPPIGVRAESETATILAFSEDEQIIFAGNPASVSRFWRALDASPRTAETAGADSHVIWQPSADSVIAALPGMAGVAIGDSEGHVHILPAGAGIAQLQAMSQDVSFIGHNAEILSLAVNRRGDLIASAAADNSVRLWDTRSGQPRPFRADVEGDAITRMAFSPDSSLLAVLSGTSAVLLSAEDGTVAAQFELNEMHRGLAFTANDRIYAGGESGALRLMAKDGEGTWSVQQPWQGSTAVHQLEASPRGEHLVIVDAKGLASQFILAEGRIGESTLALPGSVQEIAFNNSGSRAFFRTSRWTHRVSLSVDGLHWVDSVFSPKPLNEARIVFGPVGSETANRAYLPAARNGFVEMVPLAFPGSPGPGLFGNRNELLQEWRKRLGFIPPAEPTD